MTNKSIISTFIGILGIVGGAIGLASYINDIKNPTPFASETWRTVAKENIRTITIGPLLSVNSIQGLTLNRETMGTSMILCFYYIDLSMLNSGLCREKQE